MSSKFDQIKPVAVDNEFEDSRSTGSDDEDEEQHTKLIEAISKLTGKKKPKVKLRTEPVAKINAFAINETGGGGAKVEVADLLRAIKTKPKVATLEKSVKQAQKRGKKLDAPLEKPQAQRVQRTVGYEKAKDEISKWDSIVKGNRKAEQIVYPINQAAIKLPTAEEFSSKFAPKTPLEQQISLLLAGSKHVQQKDKDLTEAEKEALSAMSLKEALERRKELARIRVLQSYQEAKARRQNKIKSKKYHRLLKREKLREHMKEFESLKEKDPEAALEKLEELEKQRIEERVTLKHKGAGKWAKLQAIRAKYDDSAREALADQLRVGREMTRKVQKADDEDSDSDEEGAAPLVENTDNPWLAKSSESTEGTGGYRKLWTTINESKELRQKLAESSSGDEEGAESEEEEPEDATIETEDKELANKFCEELDEGLERKKNLEDFDEMIPETVEKAGKTKRKKKKKAPVKEPAKAPEKPTSADAAIDPNKFLSLEPVKLKSSVPQTEEGDAEDEEDQEALERRMTLAEAFADDDVVAEFKEDKRRVVDAATPKAIDLTLPGWGDWGGTGLKVSRRKKKRFIIKPAPPAPRRDENQGHLILHEDPVESIRSRQVSELPFPFRSVAAFESTVRAPVTATFIPQTAARQLAEPKVITKAGTVIEPMTEDAIVKSARHDTEDQDDEKWKKKTDRKRMSTTDAPKWADKVKMKRKKK